MLWSPFSYKEHFAAHLEDLEELIRLAKSLRNPHTEATTGVDLQVPAIMAYLNRHGLRLLGAEVVDIGSWKGQSSHAISIRLRPLHIHVVDDPKMTLEQFWQKKNASPFGKICELVKKPPPYSCIAAAFFFAALW